MAKSKKIYVAQHSSSILIYEFMDKLLQGLNDFEVINSDVQAIKGIMKTPQMIYFDTMATASRFFNLPLSTVKSAVSRNTVMRNGYKINKIDVLYNIDEHRGEHLNIKK